MKLLKIKINVMATILRFEDLEIWKEAVKIGVEIYRLTFRDKLERLWLGTDDGLYLFDRKREYIDLYDRYDNMQGDVYSSNAF